MSIKKTVNFKIHTNPAYRLVGINNGQAEGEPLKKKIKQSNEIAVNKQVPD